MDLIFSNPIFYSLALTLIHFIWQGCAVAAVLKVVLGMTSYQKPVQRYAWSMLAMIANLVLPIATFYYIYTPDYSQLVNTPFPLTIANEAIAVINGKEVLASVNLLEYLPYVTLAWIAIVICLSIKLLVELFNVNLLPKYQVTPASSELQERFEGLVKQIGLSNTPTLLISMKSQVPMVIGWLKPVVLLPATMLTGLTPSQLDMLLLHELAHVRRHDYLVNFIQTLVEILLFFHPAVRWVSKQMRNEREYCSDDIAVSVCKKPLAYAKALTETASVCHVHKRQHSIPSMAMAASGGDLKKRVVRLIDHQHHCSSSEESGRWMASAFIVFAISMVFFKPIVNFTVFDLTAGQFSIFRITSDTDYSKLISSTEPVELTESSLVSYYLDETNNIDIDRSVAEDNTNIVTSNSSFEQQDSNVEDVYSADGNNLQKSKIDSTNIAPTKQVNAVIPKEIKESQQLLNEELKLPKVSTPAEIAKLSTSKSQEVSAIEKALAATNTQDKRLGSSNPYAETIADLARPVAQPLKTDDDLKKFESSIPMSKPTTSMLEFTEPTKSVESKKPVQTSAVLLRSIDPKYPSSAKRKGIELDVLVEFTVDKFGNVSNLLFEQKSKVHFFRGSIKKAMEKWHFQPAKKNGKPIESKVSKIFSFSLSD